MGLRTLFRTATNATYLRRLLRAQEASTIALEQQTKVLHALGKVIATASGQQWSALTPARPPEGVEQDDHSGVAYADDDLLARVEAVQEDYEERFGRPISDEEALQVVADHERAAQEPFQS